MKIKLLLLSILSTNAIASVDIQAIFKDTYAQVNTASYINCGYTISIKNDTQSMRQYQVGTKVCVENKGCIEQTSNPSIESGKMYVYSNQNVYTPTFNRAGTKTASCFLWVHGVDSKSLLLNSNVYVS